MLDRLYLTAGALVFVVAGAIILAFSLFDTYRGVDLRSKAVLSKATIIQLSRPLQDVGPINETILEYSMLLRFTTKTGQITDLKGRYYVASSCFVDYGLRRWDLGIPNVYRNEDPRVGATLPVSYDPTNPQNARIDPDSCPNWFMPVNAFFVGSVCLLIAVVLFSRVPPRGTGYSLLC